MSVIRASVTDQRLKITEAPILASGGQNETSVVFTFCEKWDGFVKTAIFYRDENEVYYCVLDAENTCVVPWEVCSESGTFYMGVFGDKDGTRRTSTTVRYKVKRGAVTDDLYPSDPTPDVYSQIMDMVMDAQDNSVRVTEQDLSEGEKAIARDNIGAAYVVDVENEIDRLDNKLADVENDFDQLDSVFDNFVRHDLPQELTEDQKYQARENIDAVRAKDYEERVMEIESRLGNTIRYTSQSLTDAQKSIARNNIGAVSAVAVQNEIVRLDEAISNIGGGSQLVVTLIDFDGNNGTASHTSKQIYDHVQAGGTAVLCNYDTYYALQDVSEACATFGTKGADTPMLMSYYVWDNSSVEYYYGDLASKGHVANSCIPKPAAVAKVGQSVVVSKEDGDGNPTEWKYADLPQYIALRISSRSITHIGVVGMTWREWTESIHNTDGAYVDESDEFCSSGSDVYVYEDTGDIVMGDDYISSRVLEL